MLSTYLSYECPKWCNSSILACGAGGSGASPGFGPVFSNIKAKRSTFFFPIDEEQREQEQRIMGGLS